MEMAKMDRKDLFKTLSATTEAITLGEQHIAAQLARIQKMKTDSNDTNEAMELLEVLRATQQARIARRDGILKQWSEPPLDVS